MSEVDPISHSRILQQIAQDREENELKLKSQEAARVFIPSLITQTIEIIRKQVPSPKEKFPELDFEAFKWDDQGEDLVRRGGRLFKLNPVNLSCTIPTEKGNMVMFVNSSGYPAPERNGLDLLRFTLNVHNLDSELSLSTKKTEVVSKRLIAPKHEFRIGGPAIPMYPESKKPMELPDAQDYLDLLKILSEDPRVLFTPSAPSIARDNRC